MISEIPRFSRVCFTTQQVLVTGSAYYAVLLDSAENMLERRDYAASVWSGPPAAFIGWWRSRVPSETAKGGAAKLAPNEVLLGLFDRLEERRDDPELLYILTLLLVRRRLFRHQRDEQQIDGGSRLVAFCPKRETIYEIPIANPSPEQSTALQEHLAQLLEA